jgi:hypothetical protein
VVVVGGKGVEFVVVGVLEEVLVLEVEFGVLEVVVVTDTVVVGGSVVVVVKKNSQSFPRCQSMMLRDSLLEFAHLLYSTCHAVG